MPRDSGISPDTKTRKATSKQPASQGDLASRKQLKVVAAPTERKTNSDARKLDLEVSPEHFKMNLAQATFEATGFVRRLGES